MAKTTKSPSSDSKRGFAFDFVLYPDNVAQMRLFDWLSASDNPYNCRMIWIKHFPEEDGKKEHLHCLVRFDKQKTVGGVRKMFGIQADVWRLFTMEVVDIVDDLKMVHGSAQRVRTFVNKKIPVLSDSDNPESFIQFDYDKSNLYNAKMVSDMYVRSFGELPDDQAFIRTKIYTVPHVEVCSDSQAYALYMLHVTYDCILQGKKPYRKEDIHGNFELLCSCFPEMKSLSELDSVHRLYDLTKQVVRQSISRRDLVYKLIETSDEDTLIYLKNNSHFIRDWLLDDWKKDDYF